jgi:hypothetical protein
MFFQEHRYVFSGNQICFFRNIDMFFFQKSDMFSQEHRYVFSEFRYVFSGT